MASMRRAPLPRPAPGVLLRAARAVRWVGLVVLLACGAGGDEGVYTVRGVVEDVQPDYRQVVVDHEEIPGFMPAMTMNFDVADPALLERLEPGQQIEFRLEFDGRHFRILDAEVTGRGGSRGTRLGIAGAAPSDEPAPAFALTDQAGAPLALEDLRGRVLLLDFVYTQCPGPCPILTGLHAQAQRELPEAVRDKVHFVSISLDPERDTPEALRGYAEARGADLSRWSFLTGATETVREVVARYGVGSVRTPSGEIDHLVVTFLVDADGTIVKRYVGLEHTPDELVRDLVALASS